jgi:hypothetical protein
MKVLPIKSDECYQWLLKKHYAKRIPQIIYAFGLYEYNELKGVVTYGLPGSPMVARGICGKEQETKVLELNRLCLLNNEKNQSSFLVSNSIKLLTFDVAVLFKILFLAKSSIFRCLVIIFFNTSSLFDPLVSLSIT